MTEPVGKIVARPMVVRACGHQQEFQHYEVDRYRAQRLAKFQQTRCSECAAKVVAEQHRIAEATPKKGEVLKSLPPGTEVSLTRQADGLWSGTCPPTGRRLEQRASPGLGRNRSLSCWRGSGSRIMGLAESSASLVSDILSAWRGNARSALPHPAGCRRWGLFVARVPGDGSVLRQRWHHPVNLCLPRALLWLSAGNVLISVAVMGADLFRRSARPGIAPGWPISWCLTITVNMGLFVWSSWGWW